MDTISVAVRGEDLAAKYLEKEGWTIVGRNVRYKLGEIDIIAQRTIERGLGKANLIAFVEVKTRTSKKDPRGAERAITTKKRKKVIIAAKLFLKKNPIGACIARFDVIAITLGDEPDLRYYPNAYDSSGRI